MRLLIYTIALFVLAASVFLIACDDKGAIYIDAGADACGCEE